MKDHMKDYFPERFEDSDSYKLADKIGRIFNGYNETGCQIRCEELVGEVFSKSNEIKLLAGAMKKYGCDFKLIRHLACERCGDCNGGYDPDNNQIIICSNAKLTKNTVMATMMHEMIHMFDYCRAKFDFNNLEHVACSEVRIFQ